jgi:orotate phosphoribosyltransferase
VDPIERAIQSVMQQSALPAEVLLIDDVLATGGTIGAAIELMHRLGAEVVHVVALLEIAELQGRASLTEKYPNIPIIEIDTDQDENQTLVELYNIKSLPYFTITNIFIKFWVSIS